MLVMSRRGVPSALICSITRRSLLRALRSSWLVTPGRLGCHAYEAPVLSTVNRADFRRLYGCRSAMLTPPAASGQKPVACELGVKVAFN